MLSASGVSQGIGKNIPIDSEFSGKPFQFTKLKMLLNALVAFIPEPLDAGGDCVHKLMEAGPGLPREEANAMDKQRREVGDNVVT